MSEEVKIQRVKKQAFEGLLRDLRKYASILGKAIVLSTPPDRSKEKVTSDSESLVTKIHDLMAQENMDNAANLLAACTLIIDEIYSMSLYVPSINTKDWEPYPKMFEEFIKASTDSITKEEYEREKKEINEEFERTRQRLQDEQQMSKKWRRKEPKKV